MPSQSPHSTEHAIKHASVVGAGSWGTALACILAKRGVGVSLWCHESRVCRNIESLNENIDFFPGIKIPNSVQASSDLKQVWEFSPLVFCVVPTQHIRSVFGAVLTKSSSRKSIVNCSKGVEQASHHLISGIFEQLRPGIRSDYAALSGPSFARDVGTDLPTAVCLASHNPELAFEVQSLLSSDTFRVYTTDDVVGVELGGALKNVIAIAAGCATGLGYGVSAVAALVTRGLAEMTRLGIAMGAHPLTLSGLAGLGDLFLTCSGELSRNRSLGIELGQGKSLSQILQARKSVAEGVYTAQSAIELARKYNVEMPIVEQVNAVLHEGRSPQEAVLALMRRVPRSERD